MTDHNLARATLVIAALRAQIAGLAPEHVCAERKTVDGHAGCASVLRRDVGRAQFRIARLRQLSSGADAEVVVPEALRQVHDVCIRGGSGVPAIAG